MKLRNKKTGELGYLIAGRGMNKYKIANDSWDKCGEYISLAKLNEEWEDYEEPKEYYWFIDDAGVRLIDKTLCSEINMRKSIGNYFKTKEEAEKAVEKLKAWKRLKDIGFHFLGWNSTYKGDNVDFYLDWINSDSKEQLTKDLDLLFGGEE